MQNYEFAGRDGSPDAAPPTFEATLALSRELVARSRVTLQEVSAQLEHGATPAASPEPRP